MAYGKMFQQVFEAEYAEFLSQKIAFETGYAGNVFNGIG
jgi:hypothetical protein